jgi:hypothetical protein
MTSPQRRAVEGDKAAALEDAVRIRWDEKASLP